MKKIEEEENEDFSTAINQFRKIFRKLSNSSIICGQSKKGWKQKG